MGEIWLPMQVPSTCSRHFPAAVNTPVLNDRSTMSGMSLIQQRFRLDFVLPRGLPGCPVLDSKSTERIEQPVSCRYSRTKVCTDRKMSLRGTALKNPTRSSFHSTSSSRHALHTWAVGVQCFCHHGQHNGCHKDCA